MVTWDLVKKIFGSAEGKKILFPMLVGIVAAFVVPAVIKKTSLMMLVEMAVCIFVSNQSQKFAQLCQIEAMRNQSEEQMLNSYKKGYIRRKDD